MSTIQALNPVKTQENLQAGMIEAVSEFFPLVGKTKTLVLKNAFPSKTVDIDDIAAQKRARLQGRTWAVPIYGSFDLVDNASGKVLSSHPKVNIMKLPHYTRRYSFIVKGKGYQADSQWRLKSGAYTRIKNNGELETQFNLAKGRGFKVGFNPEKQRFLMSVGTTNVPLLPIMRAMGIPDADVKSAWGEEVFNSAVKQTKPGQLLKLSKTLDRYSEATTDAEAAEVINEVMQKTEMREDTTKLTLGKGFGKVTGESLLLAGNKLLGVSRGTDEPDNRESLQYKELWNVSDHLPERIRNSARRINMKLRNNLDRKDEINKIISPDIFNVPVRSYFTSTSLAQLGTQVNPVDMIGGHMRATIMGQGGIQSDNAISDDAKLIDSSMAGFTDPLHTPEGGRSGVTTHLALGVGKRGKEPVTKMWSMSEQKMVERSPSEVITGNVALPGQFRLKNGKMHATKEQIVVIPKGGGDPERVDPSEVDYMIPTARSLFGVTANLVPFLDSNQPNRAGMSTRHLEQVVALRDREEPLVQVASGIERPDKDTWEKIAGELQSHKSPVDGVVASISAERMVIADAKGKRHTVPLYDNFPLNDKTAMITSAPLVKKGDAVKEGEIVADTSFTKGGVLSLGTNLRIGYIAFKGLNFEDGIVISETASEKLTSLHLHKNRAYMDQGASLGLRKFRANFPGVVSETNAAKLDEDGVIKKGMLVRPGEVIAAILKKTEPTAEQAMLRGIHKSLAKPFKDRSLTWDKPFTGKVTDVARNGNELVVYVRTEEPADIGDKLSARHANKGVITAVLPDEEMPKDKDGNALQIIVNPSGVPGRMNVGQILETGLAKAAKANGTTYAVRNFAALDENRLSVSGNATKQVHVDGHWRTVKTNDGTKRIWIESYEYEIGAAGMVKKVLDDAGLSETTELFDPDTGDSLGEILVGQQYIIKHMHQIDKKMSARAHGYGYAYDANLVPRSSGKNDGAQRFGELGLYAMLAHGAVHNIRDALTSKSDRAQDEVWTAIQMGQIPPAPKTSFAYEKFLSYLNALGVNVEKAGNEIGAMPLTDKQVIGMSNGELSDGGKIVRGKDLKPEAGGLFDEAITGGVGGKEWSHIALGESIPNPIFEKGIRSLLGITGKEYDEIIAGNAGFGPDGEYDPDAKQKGTKALADRLGDIDVAKELLAANESMKTARQGELDRTNKKIKHLLMLKNNKMSARDAYILNNIPVIPPLFRPVSVMEGGDLNVDGLNMLYKDVALLNAKLTQAAGVLPDEEVSNLRIGLYDALEALMGTNATTNNGTLLDGAERPPGILTILSGRNSPKESFFHKKLMDRKQDISMRSVIVPDMDLHLDELGLPRKGAKKIFQPFTVRELVKQGFSVLDAKAEIEKDTPNARKALDIAMSKRPVLFKRDPALHKFGIMAFNAKIIESSKAIHIHPLVTGGFGADFDGDAMSVFVPVSQEAVEEAKGMLPSRNLFNPATGQVMYRPSLEGQLGLFLMTQMGKDVGKSYASPEEALAAAKAKKIRQTDVITVKGEKTTVGRLRVNQAFPVSVRSKALLTDPDTVMDKKTLQKMMTTLAKEQPAAFASTMDKVKQLGFGHAYKSGFSFTLDDFQTLRKVRGKHLTAARIRERKVRDQGLSKKAQDKAIVAIYSATTKDIERDARIAFKKSGNKLFAMHMAGVKPSWAQVSSILTAPMLMENAAGRVIPVPVERSYSEGVDPAGYWTAASGARGGLIKKVKSVSEPGALSKQLINMTMPMVITQDDCLTKKGVALSTAGSDLVGRFTIRDQKMGNEMVKTGALVTPGLLSKFKAAKVATIAVRSPTKCKSAKGMCAKCYGKVSTGKSLQIGSNVGILASQSIGERSVQISMRAFHTGGVAGTGGAALQGFGRVQELLKMPKILKGKATLAVKSGEVTSVVESGAGGFDVEVGGSKHYVPGGRTLTVKKGAVIKKGDALSTGPIDPRELLELTNLDRVQRYLTDEVHSIYKSEGVRRRNVEVVVRALTNLGVVDRPGEVGDEAGIIRNDFVSLANVAALNAKSRGSDPIKVTPVLRGINTMALDQTEDWLARLQFQGLKKTIINAANQGWKSDIHGEHPTPGIAFSAEFGKGDKSKGAGY